VIARKELWAVNHEPDFARAVDVVGRLQVEVPIAEVKLYEIEWCLRKELPQIMIADRYAPRAAEPIGARLRVLATDVAGVKNVALLVVAGGIEPHELCLPVRL
jgi:hypothetical protein